MSTSHTAARKQGRTTQVSELTHNWFVLKSLVTRDFKLKYRRSILGVLWSVLNPLLMMVVLTAVFSYMFRFQIDHYPLYLILGQIMFGMMQGATTFVNFAISLIAVVVVMIYLQVMPTWLLLYLPLLLVYVTVFTAGLGLLLSSLAVFFRDVIHFWDVICTMWMYATPIFYPIEMLPDWMLHAMKFNPMWQFITYFRDIFMWNTAPSLKLNLVCAGMAAITFCVGLFAFRKTEHKFILYV